MELAIRTLIGALALALPMPAHAERYVIVNGERLSIPQIQALERALRPDPQRQLLARLSLRGLGLRAEPAASGPRLGQLPLARPAPEPLRARHAVQPAGLDEVVETPAGNRRQLLFP
jgi:hypothetical protein